MMLTYSSGKLRYLGGVSRKLKVKLTTQIWQRIKDLDISKPVRGTRAGRMTKRENWISPNIKKWKFPRIMFTNVCGGLTSKLD